MHMQFSGLESYPPEQPVNKFSTGLFAITGGEPLCMQADSNVLLSV